MKYQLVCKKCGKVIGDLATWFAHDQQCACGSTHAEVDYSPEVYAQMGCTDWKALPASENYQADYFDFLPLEQRDAIVTLGEGCVPIERWEHLEEAAREQGVDCQVYVVRNDLNAGSGTFKDISAALAASAMREHGVKAYCLASTGNAASSYATYLKEAGITCHVFSPFDMYPATIDFIRATGQPLHLSQGNYGQAKAEAAEFHKSAGVMISAGNIDPLRIESKRCLAFECLRKLGQMPTVYLQAVAGGTGPIALEKGVRDLQRAGLDVQLPRMILAQQDECDPMVRAWEKATANGFPAGYEHDYEPRKDVHTRISILSAANPGMYPLLAPMVRRSNGTFVRVREAELAQLGRQMLAARGILMGPAAMVCYAGFFEALKQGQLRSGDCVLLNTGSSVGRATWFEEEVNHLAL